MQGTAGGEEEEDKEGDGEAHRVHYGSGQGAEAQLPQHLQCGQETVVSRLKYKKNENNNNYYY